MEWRATLTRSPLWCSLSFIRYVLPVMSIMLLRNSFIDKVGICKFEQNDHMLSEANGCLCNLLCIIQLIMYSCPIFISHFWYSVALCFLISHSWCQYTYSVHNVFKFVTLLVVCYAGDEVSPSSLAQPRQSLVELTNNVGNHTVARGLPRFGIENRPPIIPNVLGKQLQFLQDLVSNLCANYVTCKLLTPPYCWIDIDPSFIFMHIWWMTDQW